MSDVSIESAIMIDGRGSKPRVFVPLGHIKVDCGVKYIHSSTRHSWANTLFTARVTKGKKRERVFARTDIFEQLLALRMEELETVAADTQPAETLSIFDDPKKTETS